LPVSSGLRSNFLRSNSFHPASMVFRINRSWRDRSFVDSNMMYSQSVHVFC
jgi:hypothetical protein